MIPSIVVHEYKLGSSGVHPEVVIGLGLPNQAPLPMMVVWLCADDDKYKLLFLLIGKQHQLTDTPEFSLSVDGW